MEVVAPSEPRKYFTSIGICRNLLFFKFSTYICCVCLWYVCDACASINVKFFFLVIVDFVLFFFFILSPLAFFLAIFDLIRLFVFTRCDCISFKEQHQWHDVIKVRLHVKKFATVMECRDSDKKKSYLEPCTLILHFVFILFLNKKGIFVKIKI